MGIILNLRCSAARVTCTWKSVSRIPASTYCNAMVVRATSETHFVEALSSNRMYDSDVICSRCWRPWGQVQPIMHFSITISVWGVRIQSTSGSLLQPPVWPRCSLDGEPRHPQGSGVLPCVVKDARQTAERTWRKAFVAKAVFYAKLGRGMFRKACLRIAASLQMLRADLQVAG